MIQSAIDYWDKRGFVGWAIRPGSEERIHLKLYVDGALASIITANQLRPDLVSALGTATGQHGFSCQMPIDRRRTRTVRLAIIDGSAETVLREETFFPDAGLVAMSNGILTAYFDRELGGAICGLTSTDFPQVINFIDGNDNGRLLQADIGNYVDAFNPTEGGSRGVGGPGSCLTQGPALTAEGTMYTIVKMRNWSDTLETAFELKRTTRLQDRLLITRFEITNRSNAPLTDYVSADLYLDPRYLNRFVVDDWRAEPGNPALQTAAQGIAVLYNEEEGKESMAGAFTSRWTAARRELIIDGDDSISFAFPRTLFTGNRTEPITFAPSVPFVGEFALALTRGTGAARALIEVWDRG